MRVFILVISLLGLSLLGLAAAVPSASAGTLSAPGPNPNWTEMQKFEWYLGYIASSARVCGAYDEAAKLSTLARMTPYGDIGLGVITGDGFRGPICGRINKKAKEFVTDADKIRAYLETTYDCEGAECYGKSLSDWEFHDCADSLESHLASREVDPKQISKITISDVISGGHWDYHARVRFKNCQGSFYVEMKDSCAVERDYTRGDCEIAGVEPY